jgi:hypothetical protein
MPYVMYYPYCSNVSIEDVDHHVKCNDYIYKFYSFTSPLGMLGMCMWLLIFVFVSSRSKSNHLACMIYQVINLGASLDFKVHEYTVLKCSYKTMDNAMVGLYKFIKALPIFFIIKSNMLCEVESYASPPTLKFWKEKKSANTIEWLRKTYILTTLLWRCVKMNSPLDGFIFICMKMICNQWGDKFSFSFAYLYIVVYFVSMFVFIFVSSYLSYTLFNVSFFCLFICFCELL